MVAYQRGSEDAFRRLYDRHSGKIYGYLRSRLSSPSMLSDVFQDVFIKIHRSKHLYNPSLPALPWIFSVTHSVLIDALRAQARQREDSDHDLSQIPAPEQETPANVTDLLNRLPDKQRVAMQMRYVEEKTFDEIAVSLNTSSANIRQIISRGVRQLKDLAKQGEKP